MNGRFRLSWQKGPVVAYAEVVLSCQWDTRYECRILPSIPDAWATGVQFGVQVFAESILAGDRSVRGMVVEVQDVIGQAVDTSATAVAFATFRALCDATGRNDRGAFVFDEQAGRFALGTSR